LPVRERLELFCQVCDAIGHAHTKAILHRDVKASNVLAYHSDGEAVAKVIDFGVAKALTGERLTEITFSTDRGVIVGTYDSMSPEQADGSRDVDTRTDVYSLGVLLYELVAGFKPIDREALTRANDHELRRLIREVEPPRPSARLATMSKEAVARIAAARHLKPDGLIHELRGELEWIPLMALRKERERRYASPLALDCGPVVASVTARLGGLLRTWAQHYSDARLTLGADLRAVILAGLADAGRARCVLIEHSDADFSPGCREVLSGALAPLRKWQPDKPGATPRVLVTGWLEGASLSTLLDGRTDLLPPGWRELDASDAADLAGRLLGHAIYAPPACTGWMHADLHPGNFLLLPGGRLGMLDFGAVAAVPGGIPVPFGQLAAAVLAGDGTTAVRLARQVGALAPDAEPDPRLILELLHPMVATAAAGTFTYSRPWLRGLMAHFTEPRFAPALRTLTPPREYALVWRATLSAAGLYAQLGATVPTRGFHLAYSPGFRDGVLGAQRLIPRAAQAERKTGTDG